VHLAEEFPGEAADVRSRSGRPEAVADGPGHPWLPPAFRVSNRVPVADGIRASAGLRACRSALPGLARFVLGASAQMDTLVTGRFPQSLPHLARLPLLSSRRSAPEGVRVIAPSSAVDLPLATTQSARLGTAGMTDVVATVSELLSEAGALRRLQRDPHVTAGLWGAVLASGTWECNDAPVLAMQLHARRAARIAACCICGRHCDDRRRLAS